MGDLVMNDVYVVHFEFTLENLAMLFATIIAVMLLNTLAAIPVETIYRKRRSEPAPECFNPVTIILMFTWPLYLLLVLIKCLVGACVYVWRKV